MLLGASDAHARDRYRCLPADGGEPYLSPGSCRSATDAREPLTEREMADAEAVRQRGRPFYRCTAADRSYSFFVRGADEPCPAATDVRTVEYAKQAVSPQRPVAPPPAPREARSVPAPQPAAMAAAPQAGSVPGARTERAGMGVGTALAALVVAGIALAWFLGALRPRLRRVKPARTNPGPERVDPLRTGRSSASLPRPDRPAGRGTGMQQKAQDFLAALDAGADVPGGLAFLGELRLARLDYSLESLDRLDQLLARARQQIGPDHERWQGRADADNFCLMLAFYLGEMVARQARQPIAWHDREEAAALMPADMPLPDASWSRVVGVVAASPCVPLGLIEAALFGDAPAMTCRSYVQDRAARLPKPPPKDESERCAQMLDAFFEGTGIVGTLAFRDALTHSRLDYTLASLERLDQLLRSIREERQPTYEAFVNDPATQNFVRFAAFYIGMTAARLGNLSVKWLSYDEAKKDLPDLAFQFEATSVCLLSGRFCFLLGLVTEILFHPEPQRSVAGWVGAALQFPKSLLVTIPRSSAMTDAGEALDERRARAIHQAGYMAAWCMFMVQGGSVGHPTVYVPSEGGRNELFTDFGLYDSLDAGVAAAREMLESNPHLVAFQVMSFDGYANLPTGRTDALNIELRLYAGNDPSRQEAFTMVVSCPYRHASDPRGFAIYSPKLIECTAGPEHHAAIFRHFYQGIGTFSVSGFDWFQYLDERI